VIERISRATTGTSRNVLQRSRRRWNIIAQQVLMAKVDRRAGPEQAYAMDQWSG
jgi:alkaline phosphatase D